ncbi:MAG: isoaspartyl peptidase/L-asparaginase [Steroidobacteraceae bacterium]|jgi:beta-aspartyl-peptidase (threonine type)|nr:isoaspartyl peptidase/L-asparaginase [Steroidobacteraceae bacterium]
MARRNTAFWLLGVAGLLAAAGPGMSAERRMISIAIHGGAGSMNAGQLGADGGAEYRAGLAEALDAGYAVLEAGGSSLDAVATAVRLLEDNPLFNAGRGAVLTHEGEAELDASIMDGRHLRAGAVAGIRHIRNPIDLARRVMEASPHVMLFGSGAEEFAIEQGFSLVPNSWFQTPLRREQLDRVLSGRAQPRNELQGLGTVGAVAIDRNGNLAAATSTGGMTGKRWGRVGDSPIIGAGTYANNASCAVSATGHGEYFIRSVVAYDICALVEYRGWSLERAVREVIHRKLEERGGDGGVIAIDRAGGVVMEFNSDGMFRAMRDSRGRRSIAILREPPDYDRD